MLAPIGKILLSLLASLLTEAFLKRAVVLVLSKLVDKTKTDIDNELLKAAKEAWGIDA
jgi:uncharacterized protein with von Willebrand factor type A (vWA) domain